MGHFLKEIQLLGLPTHGAVLITLFSLGQLARPLPSYNEPQSNMDYKIELVLDMI